MSETLFAETQRLIIDSAQTLPKRVLPTGVIPFDLGKCHNALLMPIDRELTNSRDMRTLHALENIIEGLHVFVFGVGQIIRQSRRQDNPDIDLLTRRAVAAQHIFEKVAAQPSKESRDAQDRMGLRTMTFDNPEIRMSMYGVTLHLTDETVLQTPGQRGCPFQRSFSAVYPAIAENVIKTVVPAMSDV